MKKFIRFLLILFLLIALVVIYARYGGTEGLKTKEYTIETKDIATTFDGIKIVHFSDLHYLRVTNKDKLKQIVEEINLINPDIVFFTGDFQDKKDDKEYRLKQLEHETQLAVILNKNTETVKSNQDVIKDTKLMHVEMDKTIKEIEKAIFTLMERDGVLTANQLEMITALNDLRNLITQLKKD